MALSRVVAGIMLPQGYCSSTNKQVRNRFLWGSDVYTLDSDPVAVLQHAGYFHPSLFPPSSYKVRLLAKAGPSTELLPEGHRQCHARRGSG